MAKDERHGKIRVMVFELEGSNETIQESLRTVAQALGRNMVPTRTLPSQPALIDNGSQSSHVLIEPVESNSTDEYIAPAVNRPKKPRTYRNPEVLDIDLNSGDVPFETYCVQKNPDSDIDKYLVIASWLKEYRDIADINQDHIWTCFRRMEWMPPKDIGQTLRYAKRQGFFKAAGRGLYTINHVGLSKTNKMGE